VVDSLSGDKMARTLRTYQAQAIEQLRGALAEGRTRPVMMAPTGAGKTKVSAEIIDRAVAKGKRVAFCVPQLSLIDQTVEAFAHDGVWDVGVQQADHRLTDYSRSVQVCSIQTLERRGYPKADLVIIDECHRLSKFVARWIHDWPEIPFIGLSATPWAKGMGRLYNDLIIVATTKQLIKEGYLSKFRVFAPYTPDLSGVKVVAGDYHEGQLAEVMDQPQLTADIVETWLKCGEGRPTLCYAVDCAHARHLQERFEAAGVTAAYQDAFTSGPDRETIRRRFHSGQVSVVCNVATLTVGVDWDVRCIILARPTKSEMLFVQIIGRGLRTADGKSDCLILDHSDNHKRLGFVTDIHHKVLDVGKKAEKLPPTPKPKECPKCHYLRGANEKICPNCGYQPELSPPVWKKQNAQGRLIEVTPGYIGPLLSDDGGNAVALRGEMYTHLDFLSQLKGYCERHGKKPGFAAHQFKEMTGRWPPYDYNNVTPKEPAGPVLNWIKSRMIAYAKRRR
jgi:superfamily II DNA or RNA helicase